MICLLWLDYRYQIYFYTHHRIRVRFKHLSLVDDTDRSDIVYQVLTSMMIVCEDGSLKVFLSNEATTGLWIQHSLNPPSPFSYQRMGKKKSSGRKSTFVAVLFSVFHCQLLVADWPILLQIGRASCRERV